MREVSVSAGGKNKQAAQDRPVCRSRQRQHSRPLRARMGDLAHRPSHPRRALALLLQVVALGRAQEDEEGEGGRGRDDGDARCYPYS